MAKLIALYKTPADTAEFDSHYFTRHIPIAKTMPGLRSYEVNDGPIGGDGPFHLAAILSFDSLTGLQASLASPEGAAAVADLANFAQAGMEMLIFETKEV